MIEESNAEDAQELAELADANEQPLPKRWAYFAKKSGPGWLQGAITLGGGSLAGALYLGVIAGFALMWLQPLAMICGIIMLAAISYVTLSTGERPFQSINRNLSPALGWAWIIATLMANIVWCMPQFNLGRAAFQQNLMPSVGDGTTSTVVICSVLFAAALIINFFYGSGGKGIRLFEIILKAMVGLVVIAFILVVVVLWTKGGIDWGAIFSGLIPNPKALFEPAAAFLTLIEQSEVSDWWREKIAGDQRDKIITAFGTAVGINMTFLLPYSMLRKRWKPAHRQLAIFDLSIGLFVPFVIATACVVIASASQFHGQTGDILKEDGTVDAKMAGAWSKVLDARIGKDEAKNAQLTALKDELEALGDDPPEDEKNRLNGEMNDVRYSMPVSDQRLAAMLANRDNFNLANSLAPLTGNFWAQTIFGVGVLGMALSTIIILMLINGFVFCELFGQPGNRGIHLLGCIVAGVGGFFGPFLWGNADAKAALAIPTSVIGGSLIPIAYFTFLLMMNSRRILGENRPTGGARLIWNSLMIFATAIATFGSVWVLWGKSGSGNKFIGNITEGHVASAGLAIFGILFVLGIAGFIHHEKKAKAEDQ